MDQHDDQAQIKLDLGGKQTAGDVLGPDGQAIVTDADGMEFRVSLRGASAAIDRALR